MYYIATTLTTFILSHFLNKRKYFDKIFSMTAYYKGLSLDFFENH